jgi:hypothetical protein
MIGSSIAKRSNAYQKRYAATSACPDSHPSGGARMTRKIVILLCVLLSVSLGCGLSGEVQTSPEPALEATTPVEEPPTPDVQATENAISATEAQAELVAQINATAAQETQAALEQQQAAMQETQAALEEQAAATQEALEQASATEAYLAVMTEQAGNIYNDIQALYDEGVIASTDGTYYPLGNFDESWAQLGWWMYWQTGYTANNFVITADASWDSASDQANWPDSGCGFVFGENGEDNQNIVWLGLDGWGYLGSLRSGNGKMLAAKKYGNLEVPGEAKISLVVYDQRISFYVNDTQVLRAYDGVYKPGNVDLTLRSGTNAGFGTRCQMDNIGLWIFDE